MRRSQAIWKRDEVFHDGDTYFARLEAEIAGARESIDFETYIFDDDELGKRIAGGLKEAAQRGVIVRIIVDGVGSPRWAMRFLPELTASGVQCKVYHPLPMPFRRLFWTHPKVAKRGRARQSRFEGLLAFFRKINRRDHRKVCIVDHRAAWLGSMNVSANHVRQYSGERAWRDTGICVEGDPTAIAHLTAAFEKAWRLSRGPARGVARSFFTVRLTKDRGAHGLVRLNNTRVRRKLYFRDLLSRISLATQRVWITNPYFVPSGGLIRALRYAAENGADVRVLVPRKSDVFFMRWVLITFYGSLLRGGVRFFEYLPTILHAKTVMIDSWACVGSSNLNHRSLLHDLELDVVVSSEQSRHALEMKFQEDLKVSREVQLRDWRKIPWWDRLIGRILLMFKYWM